MPKRPLLDRTHYERPDVQARRRESKMQFALEELRRATGLAIEQARPEYWQQNLDEIEAKPAADQEIWAEFVERITTRTGI